MKKITYALFLAVMVTALFMPALAETAETTTAVSIDLTDIIVAFFGILSAVLTRYVIPWIKARTNAWQQELLSNLITTAVSAAEQKFGAGAGAEKYAYVVDYLQGKGIKIDAAAIEAAVKALPETAQKALAEGATV